MAALAFELGNTIVTLVKVSGLLFMLGSMLAVGLSLTMPMLISSVSNVRFTLLALAANFLIAPLSLTAPLTSSPATIRDCARI